MSLFISRKVFIVVAGGNASAQRHFEDTIQRKRTLEKVKRFLPSQEIENLEKIYHGTDFIVWGAVPGPSPCSSSVRRGDGDCSIMLTAAAATSWSISNSLLLTVCRETWQ